jgi:hypothetical protein
MPPKIQMKIEEKNVCNFRSTCILNTFSIDENIESGLGGFWSRISENNRNNFKSKKNHYVFHPFSSYDNVTPRMLY